MDLGDCQFMCMSPKILGYHTLLPCHTSVRARQRRRFGRKVCGCHIRSAGDLAIRVPPVVGLGGSQLNCTEKFPFFANPCESVQPKLTEIKYSTGFNRPGLFSVVPVRTTFHWEL